eukprot:285343_1
MTQLQTALEAAQTRHRAVLEQNVQRYKRELARASQATDRLQRALDAKSKDELCTPRPDLALYHGIQTQALARHSSAAATPSTTVPPPFPSPSTRAGSLAPSSSHSHSATTKGPSLISPRPTPRAANIARLERRVQLIEGHRESLQHAVEAAGSLQDDGALGGALAHMEHMLACTQVPDAPHTPLPSHSSAPIDS